jgi:hypothetical protein
MRELGEVMIEGRYTDLVKDLSKEDEDYYLIKDEHSWSHYKSESEIAGRTHIMFMAEAIRAKREKSCRSTK